MSRQSWERVGGQGSYRSGKKHQNTKHTNLFITVVCWRHEALDLFFPFSPLKTNKQVLFIMRSKGNIQWLTWTQYSSVFNLDGTSVCIKILLAMPTTIFYFFISFFSMKKGTVLTNRAVQQPHWAEPRTLLIFTQYQGDTHNKRSDINFYHKLPARGKGETAAYLVT